jgi:ABC-2 type transport system permease protein
MGSATRIAEKDLRLRLRDRSFLIMGIVTPLALAYIFHLVFGNTFTAESLDLEVGLVDLDGSEISQSLGQVLSAMDADGVILLSEFEDVAAAEAAVEDEEVGAFIQLDPGLGQAAAQGQPFTVKVVGNVDSPNSARPSDGASSRWRLRSGLARRLRTRPP